LLKIKYIYKVKKPFTSAGSLVALPLVIITVFCMGFVFMQPSLYPSEKASSQNLKNGAESAESYRAYDLEKLNSASSKSSNSSHTSSAQPTNPSSSVSPQRSPVQTPSIQSAPQVTKPIDEKPALPSQTQLTPSSDSTIKVPATNLQIKVPSL
jgi:cytoskeletal protein RodZ